MVSETTNVSKFTSEKPHRTLFNIVFVMNFSILKHYWRVNWTYKVFPLAPVSLLFFELCYALIISKSFYLLAHSTEFHLNVLKPSEMCQPSSVAFFYFKLWNFPFLWIFLPYSKVFHDESQNIVSLFMNFKK